MKGGEIHWPSPRHAASIGCWKGPVHVPPIRADLVGPLDPGRRAGVGPDAPAAGNHPGPGAAGAARAGAVVVHRRPAGGDRAAADDQPDTGHALRADELRPGARVRPGDRSPALDGLAGQPVRLRQGRGRQFVCGRRDQREHALRPGPRHRSEDLGGESRHAPLEHAGLRRVAGHGRHVQRHAGRPPPQVRGQQGRGASLHQAAAAVELSRRDRDPHPAAARREPGRLRRRRQEGLGRDGRRAHGPVPVRDRRGDRRRVRSLRDPDAHDPLGRQCPLCGQPDHGRAPLELLLRRRSSRSRWWRGTTST